MKAVWNERVVADSDATVIVEGNHYFPPESLNREYFRPSDHTTWCGWKGQASYFDLIVDGKENPDAAWTYRDPKPAASHVRDHVAFWKGVHILGEE